MKTKQIENKFTFIKWHENGTEYKFEQNFLLSALQLGKINSKITICQARRR